VTSETVAMVHSSSLASDERPYWLQELDHALAFHPHFVLSGNIRDLHRVPTLDGQIQLQTLDSIWTVLESRGYEFMMVYDPIDQLQLFKSKAGVGWPPLHTLEKFGGSMQGQFAFTDLGPLVRELQLQANLADQSGALIIDYASRFSAPLQGPQPDTDELFVTCLKVSHRAQPRGRPDGTPPPYNPVIWIAERPSDLPDWFRVGNEAVRTLSVGLPDRKHRQQIADKAARGFHDFAEQSEIEREKHILQFVLLSEGMTVRSMYSVAELARTQNYGLRRIADAVRAFKVGSSVDPWKDPTVRASIRDAASKIASEVKGQPHAIEKALDILKRSAIGLTGAHVGRSGGRPRGVLFFAGPTGVGKTELAKQISSTLFGDETAYQRFDMSEFSAEHSEARLIGAPPGYVGHDAGGELVNAIRRRPFCVLLFDEIEKAHPRILDKFLQILEDGRLTDGRGDTVYFSEAVIIFTSNLGIFEEIPAGAVLQRVQRVNPRDAKDQPAVERIVKPAIAEHFRLRLGRPELLNRIGDNIIVFDFIREDVALEILAKMLRNVTQRALEEQQIELQYSDTALAVLQREAIAAAAEYGGRGIGNRLEACLVNPLARALFESINASSGKLRVENIGRYNGSWQLELVSAT
jgi:ATP-dependent Clp protease ATP-binding subunit ClpB